MESSLDTILARCPNCSKLFSVDRNEIRTEKPQFECVQCKSRFWFAFPPPSDVREVRTHYIGAGTDASSQQEVPVKISQIQKAVPEIMKETHFACSSCGHFNLKGAGECKACGVVFEKARKVQMGIRFGDVAANPDLVAMWDRVKSDYGNQVIHEAFIKQALAQQNLQYASQQYRIIIEANPNEETAVRMRERILNIATLAYATTQRSGPPKKRMPITILISIFGLILVLTGLMLPMLRPMAPLGGMISVLGFGIHFVRKSNQT